MRYTLLLLFLFTATLVNSQIDSTGIDSTGLNPPTEPTIKKLRSFKVIGLSNGVYKVRKPNSDFTDQVRVDVEKDSLNQFIEQYRVELVNKKNIVNAARNEIDKQVRKYDREIKAIGKELLKVPELEDIGGGSGNDDTEAAETRESWTDLVMDEAFLNRLLVSQLKAMAQKKGVFVKGMSRAELTAALLN